MTWLKYLHDGKNLIALCRNLDGTYATYIGSKAEDKTIEIFDTLDDVCAAYEGVMTREEILKGL